MKNTKYDNETQGSSKKVRNFLENNNLHKRDFAQMIGVTLSYVYNIIDDTIPFSTRSTTIERIATVMDILPEDFREYVIEEDPVPYNKSLDTIKQYIKKNKMTVLDFLRLFERKKRLKLVDILRGAKPLPIDYEELKNIQEILKIPDKEFFNLWKDILSDYLAKGGNKIKKNTDLFKKMITGAEDFVLSCKNSKCNIS